MKTLRGTGADRVIDPAAEAAPAPVEGVSPVQEAGLRRPTQDAGLRPAQEAGLRPRALIERLEAGAIVGWAVGAGGRPCGVEVLYDGRVLDVDVLRLPRPDVATVTGADASEPWGFAARLPASLWSMLPASGRSRLAIRLDGVYPDGESVSIDRAALADWASQELTNGSLDGLRRLIAHVAHAGGPDVLPPLTAAQLRREARLHGWEHSLEDRDHPPVPAPASRVEGLVESVQDGVLHGWATDLIRGQEHFVLTCNGHPVDAGVIRVERADVATRWQSPRLALGFELEVPGVVWQYADTAGHCRLDLKVNGTRLSGSPLTLDRATLAGVVQASLQRALVPDDAAAAGEQQYRDLLMLEHVLAAQLAADLPAPALRHLGELAQRYGLQAPWGDALAASGLTATSAEASSPTPALDFDTVLVWRLQREFNAEVAADGRDAFEVLERLLRRHPTPGGVRQRFLCTLVPFFCASERYTALRALLDAAHLRGLCDSPSQWERSLVLPELAHAGQADAATVVLRQLAVEPGRDWLNTECVLEAVRATAIAFRRGDTDGGGLLELSYGVMELLDGLRGNPWSRLHDRNLIRSLVVMLTCADRLPDWYRVDVARCAARCYALVPDFWTACAEEPNLGVLPAPLPRARHAFEALRRALIADAPVGTEVWSTLLGPLASLRAMEADGVDRCVRELVQTVAATGCALGDADTVAGLLAELDRLTPADMLRLPAWPGAASDEVASQVDDLETLVRQASGVPGSESLSLHRDVAAALWQLRETTGTGDRAAVAARLQQVEVLALAAGSARSDWLGAAAYAAAWCLARAHLDDASFRLAPLAQIFSRALDQAPSVPAPPPAALTGALTLLDRTALQRDDAMLEVLRHDLAQRLQQRFAMPSGWAGSGAVRQGKALPPEADAITGTLVVLYTCAANLDTRVAAIRRGWWRDLPLHGMTGLIVVGGGDGELDGDVLRLDVPDDYEHLPAKTLALMRWLHAHADFEHVLKIDDDCHLDVARLCSTLSHRRHHYYGRPLRRGEGGTDRRWHQSKSASERARHAIDKSPEPSTYADGGSGYALSRHAVGELLRVARTTAGARLRRSAFMEDKLVGDLLTLAGIALADDDYHVHVRRTFGREGVPVAAYGNVFLPGLHSPTVTTHLDDTGLLPMVTERSRSAALYPKRLWPTDAPPALGGARATNQLELLSPPAAADALREAELIVVAVSRNERVLMPHFLAHYRSLGVQHFVIVDNLSDDGTREYLLDQPDVVVYSADTEYRHSHYGVAWQQAVLGAHAVGKWVLLADVDEFLAWPSDVGGSTLPQHVQALQRQGCSAATVLMVDMYPEGALADADFSAAQPFDVARCFDAQPLVYWKLGSGCYSNGPTYLSALRHRLLPNSAPNLYTSQKVPLLRYQPWVRLSEGLHYAAGLDAAPTPLYFAHFKYHSGFRAKVQREVQRRQHFNDAEEYRQYRALVAEGAGLLHDPALSLAGDGRPLFDRLLDPRHASD